MNQIYRDKRVVLNVSVGQSVKKAIGQYKEDCDYPSMSIALEELVKIGMKASGKNYPMIKERWE